MDTGRLTRGQAVAALGGVVLFASLFLDWYSLDAGGLGGLLGGIDLSASGWEAFSWVDLLCALTALVAVGAAVLTATSRTVAIPVGTSVVVSAFGLVSAVVILYRIVNQPGPNDVIVVEVGAYLGFLAAAAVAVGGWLDMLERDEVPPGLRSRLGRAFPPSDRR
jgi:hypothetical protein